MSSQNICLRSSAECRTERKQRRAHKADAKITGRGPPLSRKASPVRATVSEMASGHRRGKLRTGRRSSNG